VSKQRRGQRRHQDYKPFSPTLEELMPSAMSKEAETTSILERKRRSSALAV